MKSKQMFTYLCCTMYMYVNNDIVVLKKMNFCSTKSQEFH